MKDNFLYIPDIKYILKNRNMQELPVVLQHLPAVDLVEVWEEFSPDERLILFNILDFDKKLELFEHLPFELQKEIIDGITSNCFCAASSWLS